MGKSKMIPALFFLVAAGGLVLGAVLFLATQVEAAQKSYALVSRVKRLARLTDMDVDWVWMETENFALLMGRSHLDVVGDQLALIYTAEAAASMAWSLQERTS